MLLPLLLLCVAVLLLLLQQQCWCFLLLFVIVYRMAENSCWFIKILYMITVLPFSSFKHGLCLVHPLAVLSHLRPSFAYCNAPSVVTGMRGAKASVSPPWRSPPSIPVYYTSMIEVYHDPLTRPTPHGASRLVQGMSAWSVKTRHAPSRHCRDARVYGHIIRLRPCMAWVHPILC